ncbi:uncharacterized protein LY79DRAFT_523450 [Colletotrichum navitas]|uniref:Uncharacterized protein n=1 Tax=Colletotrichum navitas TaxID=681940 RepID=A0AAD8UZ89_9PEZI|nr:uncharacterized protein LY79DRAFT_523450 [Colletotrichum navitas]KAK1574676.1 hypothetical protein LY79DRAFT_523450 [Colletotrichum navitas]
MEDESSWLTQALMAEGIPAHQTYHGEEPVYDNAWTDDQPSIINQTELAQDMAPEADTSTPLAEHQMPPQDLADYPANFNQASGSHTVAPAAYMGYELLAVHPQQENRSYYSAYSNQQTLDAQPGELCAFENTQNLQPHNYEGVGNENIIPINGPINNGLPEQPQGQLHQSDFDLNYGQFFDDNYFGDGKESFDIPLGDASHQPQNPTSAGPLLYAPRRAAGEQDSETNVQILLGAHAQSGEDINMLGIFQTPEGLLKVLIDACELEDNRLPVPGLLLHQNGHRVGRCEDLDERAVLTPRDSFSIVFNRALKLGFDKVAEEGGVAFRVATMCSGTDGPILALREFAEAATGRGYLGVLRYDHVFSVEIDPFKQAFIERNSPPSGPIFRNVIDVGRPGAVQAMTASGAMADIPTDIDVLVAGSSCVDFSALNVQRENKKKASGLQKLFEEFKKRGITDVLGQEDPIADEVIEGLKELFENIDNEKGESTKTFLSVLLYVHAHRPKIVILENVTKAPWNQFKGFWLPAIGYSAAVVQVDSKNFLVPQTRQRKYLVAADGRRYGDGALQIVNEWAKLMAPSQWFKNPPDLQRFLLPPSDPRVLQARFQLERALLSKPKKDVEAVVCQNDHRLARRNEGLGDTHPYTRLDTRGNVVPREESWRGYISAITTRMQDLLDITCLRGSIRGFDFTFKLLVLDLGQNVDRQSARLGVMPCILPSCDPFLSFYGRPVLGLECLAVQGIPIDRISISVEKEAQLKDLAGNAMTTTVAGAAILCAIIAERSFVAKARSHLYLPCPADQAIPAYLLPDSPFDFEIYANDFDYPVNPVDPSIQPLASPSIIPTADANNSPTADASKMEWQNALFDTLHSKLVVGFLTDLCGKGRRNCLCDAFRKHQHTGTYWRCDDCDEIRCESCTGNPEHNFDKLHPVDSTRFIDKSVAYQLATVAFPAHLFVDMAKLHVDILDGPNDDQFHHHRAALQLAIEKCCGSKHYFQTSLKFREDITVTYESIDSYITLVATEKELTWNFHVRQSYFDHTDPSMEPNEATKNATYQLNSLQYDLSKPLLKAVISDPQASIIPTEDN